jgi:diaminohydroxyphosphoribosylaminopyrimidine deaminase/5-amino-6-(5-phosphoribosylamino)uracil reductase
MVGVGTVLTDDPDLTCRIPGYKPVSPVRVVADSHLRTRLTCRLVASAKQAPTWLVARDSADPERRRALEAAGAEVITVAPGTLGIDLVAAMKALGDRGLTRVLVEGGAQMAAAMLRADLVDRIAWFHAPAVMGGDGWPAAQAFGTDRLAAMPRFVRASAMELGEDMLTELRRAA